MGRHLPHEERRQQHADQRIYRSEPDSACSSGGCTHMRIAVVGAGAVGCYFGGMLARAGHEVTLIALAGHVEAIGRDGLLMQTLSFREHVRISAATEVAAQAARMVMPHDPWTAVGAISIDDSSVLRLLWICLAPAVGALAAYDWDFFQHQRSNGDGV